MAKLNTISHDQDRRYQRTPSANLRRTQCPHALHSLQGVFRGIMMHEIALNPYEQRANRQNRKASFCTRETRAEIGISLQLVEQSEKVVWAAICEEHSSAISTRSR